MDKITTSQKQIWKKEFGWDDEFVAITKQMKQFQNAVEEICLSENRTCSDKEIADKLKISQQSAHWLKKKCVSADLIDFTFGKKNSLRPCNFYHKNGKDGD